uniref:Uncharacterized protein n=1 Tax=Phaeomonas parva TaxID=124430 RepID=A0A7S1XP41_9STRA|mmetsp:Transcript_20824/g.63392  ORF Transcript_20824/g.63392 Transcript_20824/m.63392 type:complete len:239 (+) Transcript_20824:87-803(+)
MDAALLKQLQTAPRRGAAGSAPSPAPLEHPSNAPFKERYEKAYVVASKRKRWAAQEHAEEVSENDRIQDPMAARIELGQTRDDIGTGTWTGGLVLARLLEALCDEPLPGISGRLEDLCTGVDVEPGPSTGPVSPAVAAKPFITDAARALPVVELGSGTGVGGLGAALFAGFLDVTLTDRPGPVLENLERNIERNVAKFRERGLYTCDRIAAAALDWLDVGEFGPGLVRVGSIPREPPS